METGKTHLCALYRLFFVRLTFFCHQLTQNIATDFVRFTQIYTNFSGIQNLSKSLKIWHNKSLCFGLIGDKYVDLTKNRLQSLRKRWVYLVKQIKYDFKRYSKPLQKRKTNGLRCLQQRSALKFSSHSRLIWTKELQAGAGAPK